MELEKSVQILTLIIFGVPAAIGVIWGVGFVLTKVFMWGIAG